MVITISNTDDFIRALRENEEFQAAARRELLTQDLLELPAVVLDDRMNSDTRGRSYENTEQFVNANASAREACLRLGFTLASRAGSQTRQSRLLPANILFRTSS